MSLHANAVSFAYGDHAVLRALDCELAEGQITAIVGANASGKSTLLRAMARLIAPQSGSVLLDGTPISSSPRARSRAASAYCRRRRSRL